MSHHSFFTFLVYFSHQNGYSLLRIVAFVAEISIWTHQRDRMDVKIDRSSLATETRLLTLVAMIPSTHRDYTTLKWCLFASSTRRRKKKQRWIKNNGVDITRSESKTNCGSNTLHIITTLIAQKWKAPRWTNCLRIRNCAAVMERLSRIPKYPKSDRPLCHRRPSY